MKDQKLIYSLGKRKVDKEETKLVFALCHKPQPLPQSQGPIFNFKSIAINVSNCL